MYYIKCVTHNVSFFSTEDKRVTKQLELAARKLSAILEAEEKALQTEETQELTAVHKDQIQTTARNTNRYVLLPK